MIAGPRAARRGQDRPGDDGAVRGDHEGQAAPRGFRSCLGILSLLRSYGPDRIEAAARRGNDIAATTYGSIKSILQNGLDRAYAPTNAADVAPIQHANIRGRGYYH